MTIAQKILVDNEVEASVGTIAEALNAVTASLEGDPDATNTITGALGALTAARAAAAEDDGTQ